MRSVSTNQRQLLHELTRTISRRLSSEFSELPGAGTENVGITLRERGRRAVVELPGDLLTQATGDTTARETLRIRLKAARDRMLFRSPPPPLPKNITALAFPGAGPGGRGGPGGGQRFRRGGR